MLSKNLLRSRRLLLFSLKNSRIQSCNIHVLCSRTRLSSPSTALLVNYSQIISRFESSHAVEKDKILNLPAESTNTVGATQVTSSDLPDIPLAENASEVASTISDIPEIIADAVVPLNKLGEPCLQALGLGSKWTPVGWVQNLLEFMHCTFDLPWWGSISICVVIFRLLVFPLVIKQQRSSIDLHNVMPKMQAIQRKIDNARMYGNHMEAMKSAQELGKFLQESNVNPAKSFVIPMVQAPIFISFFMGLRSMANTPVESMSRGGLWWFSDLTEMDPYYLLPLFTCATLYVTIQVGAEMGTTPKSGSPLGKYMPYVMKLIPVCVFPFIMHFPSALCVYWATTNAVSLTQVLFLRIPTVRKYFGIQKKQKNKEAPVEGPKKGVVKDFKSSISNMRLAKEIEERDRLDEMNFRRAGRQPPTRTFKENPLVKEAIQAKKN